MRLPYIEPGKLIQVIDSLELAQTRKLVADFKARGRSMSSLLDDPRQARFLARALADGIPDYTEPELLRKPVKPTPPAIALQLKDRRQVLKWNDSIQADDSSLLDYQKLEGDWLDWLEVAQRYEFKVPYQDRGDLRHSIIIELAQARQRTTEPIPQYRAYRIASYIVADYYRSQRKLNSGLDCQNCSKPQRAKCKEGDLYRQCPKLISLVSLDTETIDGNGNRLTLKDIIADDQAIDLDLWLDSLTFLLGCPIRLVQIAYKRQAGLPLTETERRYFNRQRAKELKKYQKALF